MTRALLYRPRHKWRFSAALGAAAVIHLAAITFANTRKAEPPIVSGFSGEPPEITFEPLQPIDVPPADLSDPPLVSPSLEQTFIEETPTPPSIRRQSTKFTPIVRPRIAAGSSSIKLSSAKVFAVCAPQPEYPYEARRQKITGDGIAVMDVDPITGNVMGVSMSKTTGSPYLDNAAVAGFKRWRFKPGSVTSVTCPVTFTLTGVAY